MSADTMVAGSTNPQNLNRYGYVRNNPLRFTDPSGHTVACNPMEDDCHHDSSTSSNGTGSGNGNNDGNNGEDNDPDPNPNGLPPPTNCLPGELTCQLAQELHCDAYSIYSPCNAGWHYYSNADNPYLVCPAAYHCTTQEIFDYLLRFAFPGQDPTVPVFQGGIYPVSYNGRSLGTLGMIIVSVNQSQLTTVNTTLPGHIFYNGTVTRSVSQGSDGSWYVTTTGVGNNVEFGMNTFNQMMGPGIFNALDQEMFDYIAAQH